MTTPTMRARLLEKVSIAFTRDSSADEILDAVLAELRQPDEVMWAAGADRDALGWDADPGTVFTAMIDAIRGEQG